MQKSLDVKLSRILSNPSCTDFILADAKDADMAYGVASPGRSPEHHAQEGRFRTLDEYRELIRQNVGQGLVDIMLMSGSTNAVLTLQERLFDKSHVTPAIRANDATDIWAAQGGAYLREPARPFRSASLDQAMCGKPECRPEQRRQGADLGLYSITLNNDLGLDHQTLTAYKAFREEAAAKDFRHFLEVFDPNALQNPVPDLGRYINDMIVRTLAGVAGKAAALVSQSRVPWTGRDGATRFLRLAVGGGHPGRGLGDDARRLPSALGSEEVRRPRGPVRTHDQQRRAPVDFYRAPAGLGRRPPAAGRGRAVVPCGPGTSWRPPLSQAGGRSAGDAPRRGIRRDKARIASKAPLYLWERGRG